MTGRAVSPQARVAVVVLNYNGLDDTIRCLQSLRAVPDELQRVILVDNASEVDPGPDASRAYPGVELVRNAQNLGYAGGNNRGIERALGLGADYVVLLNNDTVVAPSIIRSLLAAFATDESLGIVGPVINFLDEPGRVMTDGVTFNPGPGTEFFRRLVVAVLPAGPSGPPVVRVDIVNGCCLMVKAGLFNAIGMFDEQFFIVHEESDLCLRASAAGFGCAVVGESLVWHKGSSAFERAGRQWQRYFDTRNLYYLLKRHTGRVSSSRPLAPSLWHYLLYAFYRYDFAREAGNTSAAHAVIDGLYDALRGWSGPYQRRSRVGVGATRAVFAAARLMARARRPRRARKRAGDLN